MHSLSLFFGLLALVAPSFAAVTTPSVKVSTYDGPVNPGCYIVKARDGERDNLLNLVTSIAGGNVQATRSLDIINGFAGLSSHLCGRVILGLNQVVVGCFDGTVLGALQSSTGVEYITEDGMMSTFDVQKQYVEPPPSV
jgi:hypothetical protein